MKDFKTIFNNINKIIIICYYFLDIIKKILTAFDEYV